MGCLLRLFSIFSPFCIELTEPSRELGRLHRVLPSFSRYTIRLVSGNGIDSVSPKSVMNGRVVPDSVDFLNPGRKEEMERPILRTTGSVVVVTSVGVVMVVYAEMGKGFI